MDQSLRPPHRGVSPAPRFGVAWIDATVGLRGDDLPIPERTQPRDLGLAVDVGAFVDAIRAQLADDHPETAFRIVLSLHDRLNALTPAALAAAVTPDPGLTGSARYDALLAGLIEHHCVRAGLGAPGWTELPTRFLTKPWYVDDSDWGRAHDRDAAPDAFLRRGVILAESELGSV